MHTTSISTTDREAAPPTSSSGPSPIPTGHRSLEEPERLDRLLPAPPEFIGIPEWCRRLGCSLDTGYRAARSGDIPGLFSVGRLRRINWDAFVDATRSAS